MSSHELTAQVSVAVRPCFMLCVETPIPHTGTALSVRSGANYGVIHVVRPEVPHLRSSTTSQARAHMHIYTAKVTWQRGDQSFVDNRYSRRHMIEFDGGVAIPGSSSPNVVRVPLSDPSAVDPEEAFVASLSSCHMLCFLSEAASSGFRVDSYSDHAQGVMGKGKRGKLAVTTVTLRPVVSFSGGNLPTLTEFQELHHKAHEVCFIANSVTTDVQCEPVLKPAG
jgi:organic hydroperoxide reductase OsmC/OhrA